MGFSELKYLKLKIQSGEKTFLFMKCKPETHNSGLKNSNVKVEIKALEINDPPFKKPVSGYKSSKGHQLLN